MIEIKNKKQCCGCSACINVCPMKCINFKTDNEGFNYPQVNEEKCINCKLCEKICPINNAPKLSKNTQVYAAQNKDAFQRKSSTSGGLFYAIAKYIIAQGGSVCGAAYDNNCKVIHKLVNNVEDLYELAGSKYVQSDLNKVFSEIKLLLKTQQVLFVGTPCQVAGLKKFIGENDNLYLIDLVCYGVPSPKVYNLWIKYLEKKYRKKIKKIYFRDKSYGFAAPNVKIEFKDNTVLDQTIPIKTYMKVFMKGLSVRPSCTNCSFKSVERASDITFGDCWSIGQFDSTLDDNMGTTAVYIHSLKGKKIIEKVQNNINLVQIDKNLEIKYDGKKMIESVKENNYRKEFLENIDDNNFAEMVKSYAPTTIKEMLVTYAKKNLKNSKMLKKLLKKTRGKH